MDSLGQCDFVKFVILSRRIGILYRGPSSLYTRIIELGKTVTNEVICLLNYTHANRNQMHAPQV